MPEDAAMLEYDVPEYKVIHVPTEIGRLSWLGGDEWRAKFKVEYKVTYVPTEIGPLSWLDGDKLRITSNDESNDESEAETIKNEQPLAMNPALNL
jgi:hypothetical protein